MCHRQASDSLKLRLAEGKIFLPPVVVVVL